jgi:phosphatidylserine synthase
MGAVHWGLAMLQTNMEYQRQLVFSVIPALVAWLALFLPEILNYSVLIIAFALLCLFDTRMSKTGRAPSWYPRLRSPLTTVVVASLLMAQFQYLPFH